MRNVQECLDREGEEETADLGVKQSLRALRNQMRSGNQVDIRSFIASLENQSFRFGVGEDQNDANEVISVILDKLGLCMCYKVDTTYHLDDHTQTITSNERATFLNVPLEKSEVSLQVLLQNSLQNTDHGTFNVNQLSAWAGPRGVAQVQKKVDRFEIAPQFLGLHLVREYAKTADQVEEEGLPVGPHNSYTPNRGDHVNTKIYSGINQSRIQVPLTITLDVKGDRVVYELSSMSVKTGGLLAGHYYAIKFDRENKQYIKYNDEEVTTNDRLTEGDLAGITDLVYEIRKDQDTQEESCTTGNLDNQEAIRGLLGLQQETGSPMDVDQDTQEESCTTGNLDDQEAIAGLLDLQQETGSPMDVDQDMQEESYTTGNLEDHIKSEDFELTEALIRFIEAQNSYIAGSNKKDWIVQRLSSNENKEIFVPMDYKNNLPKFNKCINTYLKNILEVSQFKQEISLERSKIRLYCYPKQVESALRVLQHIEKKSPEKGYLLANGTGTGKSHVAAIAIMSLLKKDKETGAE